MKFEKKNLDEISEDIKAIIKDSSISDDVIMEIVNNTFDDKVEGRSFPYAMSQAKLVSKAVSSNHKKDYSKVGEALSQYILNNKDEWISKKYVRDVKYDFSKDNATKIFNGFNKNKSYVNEFLDNRDKLLEILKDDKKTEEDKEKAIQDIQNNANYKKDVNPLNSENDHFLDLLYATNVTLLENYNRYKNLKTDEDRKEYAEAKDNYDKCVKLWMEACLENSKEDKKELLAELEFGFKDLTEDEKNKKIKEINKLMGWKKDETPKQKKEVELLMGENKASKDEFVNSMLEFEEENNDDIKKLKNEIDEIDKEIADINSDTFYTDDKKALEISIKEDEKKNKLAEIDKLKDKLKKEYSDKYDKFIEYFTELSNSNFYSKNSPSDGPSMFEKTEIKDNIDATKLYDKNNEFDYEGSKSKSKDKDKDKDKDSDSDKDKKKDDTKKEKGSNGTNSNGTNSNASNSNGTVNGDDAKEKAEKSDLPLVVNDVEQANKIIEEFLNGDYDYQSNFLDKYGYEALQRAINIDGVKLEKNQIKKMKSVIGDKLKTEYSKDAINKEYENIKKAMNALGLSNNEKSLLLDMYNFDNKTEAPQILEKKLDEDNLRTLNILLDSYFSNIKGGSKLPEDVRNTFENYFIKPLNAASLMHDLNNKTITGKIKNIVTGVNKNFVDVNRNLSCITAANNNIKANTIPHLRDDGSKTFEDSLHDKVNDVPTSGKDTPAPPKGGKDAPTR